MFGGRWTWCLTSDEFRLLFWSFLPQYFHTLSRNLSSKISWGPLECIPLKQTISTSTIHIRMSHWRHTMVDGAEFWISCQWLEILRKASHWQLIQNSAPSTIVWRQCDIRIDLKTFVWYSNCLPHISNLRLSLISTYVIDFRCSIWTSLSSKSHTDIVNSSRMFSSNNHHSIEQANKYSLLQENLSNIIIPHPAKRLRDRI